MNKEDKKWCASCKRYHPPENFRRDRRYNRKCKDCDAKIKRMEAGRLKAHRLAMVKAGLIKANED